MSQFLSGNTPSLKIRSNLGAVHHARWMSAAICILKMFIFEDFFDTPEKKKQEIRSFVMFIVYLYFVAWLRSVTLKDVPVITLKLFKNLSTWGIAPEQTRAAQRKLDLHTDYLNGRNVVFALASDIVDSAQKEDMAKALLEKQKPEIECGRPIAPRVYDDSELSDFIDEESWLIFTSCGIEPNFLSLPVNEWPDTESYRKFCTVISSFSPTNDRGERAVKFGSDYHNFLNFDPTQHQAVLQTVESHRRKKPRARK